MPGAPPFRSLIAIGWGIERSSTVVVVCTEGRRHHPEETLRTLERFRKNSLIVARALYEFDSIADFRGKPDVVADDDPQVRSSR